MRFGLSRSTFYSLESLVSSLQLSRRQVFEKNEMPEEVDFGQTFWGNKSRPQVPTDFSRLKATNFKFLFFCVLKKRGMVHGLQGFSSFQKVFVCLPPIQS